MEFYFKKVHPDAVLPTYAKPGDAGMDITSAEDILLEPGHWYAVSTGIASEFPPGYVLLVCSRSGLAKNEGVAVLNAPGVVDSGYRGEIKVLLVNHSTHLGYAVKKGQKIAQLLFTKVSSEVVWVEKTELSESERGTGGFGSTGE